jgi:hypothetical protein
MVRLEKDSSCRESGVEIRSEAELTKPSRAMTRSQVRSIRVVAIAAVLATLGIVIILGGDWCAAIFSDRYISKLLVNGVLTVLLEGYLIALGAAVIGAVLLGWKTCALWRRRSPECSSAPRLRAMRWAFLCASWLFGSAAAEVGAFVWLKWHHRIPAWPRAAVRSPHAEDEIEIVVIGESSARGVPYDDWLSVGQIVGRELQAALLARRIHVNVLAESGATLEAMHHKLARLDRSPDALIVYSGHNEFLARFTLENRVPYYRDELPHTRGASWWQLVGHASPFLTLVHENLAKERVGVIPARGLSAAETIVGRPACSRAEADVVVADFERRLAAIVATCLRIDCLPILIIPPGNDASDPSQSYAHPETTADARRQLFRQLTEVRAIERRDPATAIVAYRELVIHQPTHALLRFRLARLLENEGKYGEAQDHYVLARDHDGLPLRCISRIEAAYRNVANRFGNGVVLVDGPAALRMESRHGILDNGLFHDNVHPTLAGHIALARAVLAELKARGAFGWPAAVPVPVLGIRSCARQFGFQARDWATVCERAAGHYGQIAFLTIDSAERVQWRDRYAAAARQIRAGTAPELAGIPAVGFHGTE